MSWFESWYDRLMAPLERGAVGRWRRDLLLRAKGNVLEIGVGTGANLPYYPSDVQVIGIEPAQDMLQRAQAKVRTDRVEFRSGVAERLEFPDDHFDTVVATLVLCSVTDPLLSVREMYRVLKPGGQLLLLDHVVSEHRVVRGIQHAANPVWKRAMGNCHLNRDTAQTVREVFGRVEIRPYARGLVLALEAEKDG